MKNSKNHIPVVIIGGGPVGLFLAISLLKKGINCRVLEKRKSPIPDSRSLGIHPVSLELFGEVDIIAPFLEKGIQIQKGIAFTERKKLGEISFQDCPKPYNYILACPQFTTEEILRNELNNLDKNALITGAKFEQFDEKDNHINIYFKFKDQSKELTADFIVGCDGKKSLVRQQAGIHYSGKRYHDTYVMGDFEDTTNFKTDAVVFLPKKGLIECFPLPNGMRRWVVKTESYIPNPTSRIIAELVKERIVHDLHSVNHTMLSSFGVQYFMAETFAKGRILLAGDSAHVVSPIGGQGMNLGWLDCKALSSAFYAFFNNSEAFNPSHFKNYSIGQQKIARKAARRSEINMALGRKPAIPFVRNLFIQTILNSRLREKAAQAFTMRGLYNWWI